MIHITQRIKIAIKQTTDSDYMPDNMSVQKLYPVVAEKTRKVKRENKKTKEMYEDEEIYFGYVGDDYQLHFVASFNCHAIVDYENEEDRISLYKEETDNFYRYLQKIGFRGEKQN